MGFRQLVIVLCILSYGGIAAGQNNNKNKEVGFICGVDQRSRTFPIGYCSKPVPAGGAGVSQQSFSTLVKANAVSTDNLRKGGFNCIGLAGTTPHCCKAGQDFNNKQMSTQQISANCQSTCGS